jgi:hypothetical protein
MAENLKMLLKGEIMLPLSRSILPAVALVALLSVLTFAQSSYPVLDTAQSNCYDSDTVMASPAPGESFYGQDAQYSGNLPVYSYSDDGLTVSDSVTGLTWQRAADTDLDGVLEPADKLSWWDGLEQPALLNSISFGGYDDWRLPNIKELYSLIVFSGVDPSGWEGDTSGLIPFIDRNYFEFIYGDESVGERIIDSQYWTSTEYVSTTMYGDHTVFGVNFADGRIKGYGTSLHGQDKTAFVQCVRGNSEYSVNDFSDNGDGTITDQATGLMWLQSDNGSGVIWEEALHNAETLEFAGYDDWRLPNAKELQSIIDYTRSLDTDGTAAIDPLFSCTSITDEGGDENFPFYWTSTTHSNWTVNPGAAAAYLAFGEALGWMQEPFPPFEWELLDAHGAGAQRSDPKVGDPDDWPYGHGPQGDVIRIYNYVRCVRDAATEPADPISDLGITVSNQHIFLSWSAPADATIYHIYRSEDPFDEWINIGSTMTTDWTQPVSGNRQFFRVTWE